jgi:hypothetical protein
MRMLLYCKALKTKNQNMRLAIPLILALMLQLSPLLAQENRKLGDVKVVDFKIPEGISDSSAGAIVLFDMASNYFNYSFQLEFECHIRIYILNSSEFDRADIKIAHRTKDNVSKIKASSFNLVDGKVVESSISRKDIFTEKVTDDVNQERFSIPNVKEGSIIEYSYSVSYEDRASFNTWYFQMDIPVAYSRYTVKIPEYLGYKQVLSGVLPLTDYQENSSFGRTKDLTYNVDERTFIAKNVPAFVSEPFISSKENYISKITFRLSTVSFPGSQIQRFTPDNYSELSKKIAKDEYHAGVYKNNNFFNDDLEVIKSGKDSDLDIIKAIYTHVQKEYTIDNEVLSTNLRRIFNEKRGFRQDINMILTSMLHNAGYESYLVKISTKAHGPLNPIYFSSSNFNYTVCLVKYDGQEYLLDASEEFLPFNSLRPETVNGEGLIISENNPGWVTLKYNGSNYEKGYSKIEISESGTISANIKLQKKQYSAYDFKKQYSNYSNYLSDIEEKLVTFSILEHDIVDIEEGNLQEQLIFEIEQQVNQIGNEVNFTPIIFNKLTENPYKIETRKLPVTLHSPIDNKYSYTIELPEGYEVKELPESTSMALPNEGGKYLFSCERMNNTIVVNSLLTINQTYFTVVEYYNLREFYARIIEKQAEQIVLAKKL